MSVASHDFLIPSVIERWFMLIDSVTVVNCGALTDPSNGTVDTSSGITYLQRATYTCDTGYTLIGGNTRTCGANGMWSSSQPACECECDLHSFNTTHCSLQSLSCPLEALSTLTTQLCPSPSLERAPLPSPVTLSYPPAAGNKTIPMEWLSEGGEDQMGSVYLQRLTLEQQLRDSTSPEMSALSA